MINPINNAHNVDIQSPQKPQPPKQQPESQTQKNGALSHDQVTLKSTGQAEHSSESK